MLFTKPKYNLSWGDINRAMETLFGRYQEFRGTGPWAICEKCGIKVERDKNYSPIQAKARCDGENAKTIVLTEQNDSLDLLSYLGYHELAHCFLAEIGIITPLGSLAYHRADVWCDNFAIAMLFCEKAHDFWRGCDLRKFSEFLERGWRNDSQRLGENSCQRILFWAAELKRTEKGKRKEKRREINDLLSRFIRLANALAAHEPG